MEIVLKLGFLHEAILLQSKRCLPWTAYVEETIKL